MKKRLSILYYSWGEVTAQDCIESMRRAGHKVTILRKTISDYDFDEDMVALLLRYFKCDKFDCIFSFNYIPLISWLCQELKVKYVSWVYDSPHLTLNSLSINNEYNDIFLFDKGLYKKMKNCGASRIEYMPLPYNKNRINKLINNARMQYLHKVSFLGSLYKDESNNYYDQIRYIPEKDKAYIDELISRQLTDFSVDIFETEMDYKLCEELRKYIKFDLGPYYRGYHDDIIRGIFKKKVTTIERTKLLEDISKEYPVDLYSDRDPGISSVNYKGYADYYSEMPLIFYTSEINLNITVRHNISGLPLRVIDILGARGFLLTSYQSEMEEYFEDEKSICWFKSPEEMMDKLRFFMGNESERQKIAEEGNKVAASTFDYDVLLPKVLANV